MSALVLAVAPGAWVSASAVGLGGPARLALAAGLSPFVAALELLALRAAGVGFAAAVPMLTVANLPALALLAWRTRADGAGWLAPGAAAGALLFAAVAACVAIPWWWDPVFRHWSWHALLHTDVVYAFARGELVPEDPELAGVTLAYPWLAHAHWALLAWSADVSPTLLYPFVNLLLLGAAGVLCHALARALGASVPGALATCGVLALGTNPVGLVGWSLVPPNDNGLWWALAGDLRYAPFVVKFVTCEIMPIGLVLVAGLALLCVRGVPPEGRAARRLAPVVLAALGGTYPNLFPAGAVLLGALGLVLLVRQWRGRGALPAREWAVLAALGAIALAVGVGFVAVYTLDRTTGALELSGVLSAGKKAVAATLALSPFAWAASWAWRTQPREGTGRDALALLALGAAGAVALNLALRIGGLNEYKFLYVAGLCLAPAAVVGVERRWLRTPRSRWPVVAVLPALLALVMVSYSVLRIPHGGSAPLPAREDGFWLELAPEVREAGWTRAVRTRTPPDTLLVVMHPDFHVSAFAARTLWVPSERDAPHFGYNIPARFNMVVERGYGAERYDERIAQLERLYAADSPAALDAALAPLRAAGRPVAVVFAPGQGRDALAALLARPDVERLYDGGAGDTTVVLLRP